VEVYFQPAWSNRFDHSCCLPLEEKIEVGTRRQGEDSGYSFEHIASLVIVAASLELVPGVVRIRSMDT